MLERAKGAAGSGGAWAQVDAAVRTLSPAVGTGPTMVVTVGDDGLVALAGAVGGDGLPANSSSSLSLALLRTYVTAPSSRLCHAFD
jgi:hypothetical protein